MKIDGDSAIEKVARKSDWYEMISKPIPAPGEDEPRDKFISRCVSSLSHVDSDKPHSEIVAMCHSAYRGKKK